MTHLTPGPHMGNVVFYPRQQNLSLACRTIESTWVSHFRAFSSPALNAFGTKNLELLYINSPLSLTDKLSYWTKPILSNNLDHFSAKMQVGPNFPTRWFLISKQSESVGNVGYQINLLWHSVSLASSVLFPLFPIHRLLPFPCIAQGLPVIL